MSGLGRQMCGLSLCLLGILGVALISGLPMWRETSFVGANVVTAQSVWDGLWLHCVVQATGQMQCKRHTFPSLTTDLQAGRALCLISVICGFLGFMVVLLGGGVVNCSGDEDQDPYQYRAITPTRKKACILGGALCALSGVLCLVSVCWSAFFTNSINNDPLVAAALKREVGSCVYIGLVSSLLLLLSAVLVGMVCWETTNVLSPPSDYSHITYSDDSAIVRSDRRGPIPNKASRYSYPVNSPESLYSNMQWGKELQYPDPFFAPVFL